MLTIFYLEEIFLHRNKQIQIPNEQIQKLLINPLTRKVSELLLMTAIKDYKEENPYLLKLIKTIKGKNGINGIKILAIKDKKGGRKLRSKKRSKRPVKSHRIKSQRKIGKRTVVLRGGAKSSRSKTGSSRSKSRGRDKVEVVVSPSSVPSVGPVNYFRRGPRWGSRSSRSRSPSSVPSVGRNQLSMDRLVDRLDRLDIMLKQQDKRRNAPTIYDGLLKILKIIVGFILLYFILKVCIDDGKVPFTKLPFTTENVYKELTETIPKDMKDDTVRVIEYINNVDSGEIYIRLTDRLEGYMANVYGNWVKKKLTGYRDKYPDWGEYQFHMGGGEEEYVITVINHNESDEPKPRLLDQKEIEDLTPCADVMYADDYLYMAWEQATKDGKPKETTKYCRGFMI